MIFPKDGKYVCRKCGYEGEIKKKSDKPKDPALDNGKIYTEEGKAAVDDDMVVIDKDTITLPKTKVFCEKCGHPEAYYYIRQTRSADEPSTTFYRCCKCNHSWREN